MGLKLESRCVCCRRFNTKLFLKGERCFSNKCALERRRRGPVIPDRRMSQYARQLREKQKLRFKYGIVETQFKRYYEKAEKMKGITGDGSSRSQARQLVSHGHFLVRGQRVKTPSYLVKEGDIIEPDEKSKKLEVIKQNVQNLTGRIIPAWLEMDTKLLRGKVLRLPEKEELDQEVDVSLIVEYYSR